MADKARNLRKLLSKNKDNNKHKEHFNTQPTNEDDPLQFLDNNNNNGLSKEDNELINDIIHKKCVYDNTPKQQEEEKVTMASFRSSVIQANASLNTRSKLFSTINQLQQIKQNEEKVYAIQHEVKQTPGKIGLNELNEAQKRRTMSRMASAQMNLHKSAGKIGGGDLVKKASEVILSKARQLESKINSDNNNGNDSNNALINSNNIGLKIFNKIKQTVDSTVFMSMNSIKKEQDEINQMMLMRRTIHYRNNNNTQSNI
jgi:hypothetical protein